MIAIRNEVSGPSFILASLLAAYPDEQFAPNVRMMLDTGEIESNRIAELIERIEFMLASSEQLDDLRSEYIDLFDRGRQVNSLYETEYGRERSMVKGNQLVDIAGFYSAFGFKTGGDGVLPEMVDHVAVELEFYALLILKSAILSDQHDREGEEIVLNARKEFLKSHLGRFVGSICERPGVATSPFYSAAFKFCSELVAQECDQLGVKVDPERWLADPVKSEDELSCGGSAGCMKAKEDRAK